MTAHLTTAEARALGIDTATPGRGQSAGGARRKRNRRTASRDGAVTVCHDCAARFTRDADETRHVETTHHARYEVEL